MSIMRSLYVMRGRIKELSVVKHSHSVFLVTVSYNAHSVDLSLPLSSPLVAGADPYIPSQMSSGGMQDMYGRPPSAMGMGQRSQYPYAQGYDRR